MKLMCRCGKMYSDNTDRIPYKARLIADEDWDEFAESCERPIGYDPRLVTDIYQCPQCGLIRIERPTGNVVILKEADEKALKPLLGSVHSQH